MGYLPAAETGGFFTEEIRQHGERVGFRTKDIRGREAILAHRDYDSPYRVGRYGVDVAVLEDIALPALDHALAYCSFVIIDELGKMELYSSRFQEKVLELLDSSKQVIGVIQQRSNPFLDRIRGRGDVEIIEVTRDNRDHLLGILRHRILRPGEPIERR